jgi:class 3 adenylate cyclase
MVEQTLRENERLLLNILPESIVTRLRSGEMVIADRIEEITVLFADVVGFTELAARLSATEVITMLRPARSREDQDHRRRLHGLRRVDVACNRPCHPGR